ncbi:MAG: DNA adenine methylase [Thaumarchaeota archaeon]|nr:DNA adenine methylase [Nitrososphaerota archaeon]
MILKSEVRSPLRYAGGKTRGIKEITKFIPNDVKEICSPFFGGGSVELACANNNVRVYGYDNFEPLVEFWQCLLLNPIKLVEIVKQYYPLSKTKFYELQKTQQEYRSKYERAAIFFVLNRSSFSGTTMSGGMSPHHPRFTLSSIEKLANFKVSGVTVDLADFKQSIKKHRTKLLYLDPPYLINQRLYGNNGDMHNGFDHKCLVEILQDRKLWILSYNDSDEIHKLYNSYTFYYPTWKYGMSNNKNSREVIILSHEIAEMNGIRSHGHTNPIWQSV